MNDPRVAALSPNARDLLERILAAFPHETLFGSGVPAAPAQLRLTLYHSDDPRLDSQIGRQLKELELNSIGILRRVSRKTRYLKLTLDFCQAPGPMRRDHVIPNYDSRCNAVIHNPAGLSPPLDSKEIAVVAATAISSSDLIEKLQPYFPRHDVSSEFKRYYAHREKIGRPVVTSAFVKWMLRAEVPLKRENRRKLQALAVAHQTPDSDQMDLFEESAAQRFIAEFQERKRRKAIA